ncbi:MULTISPECIES: DUF2530 domain-containing protein [Isoptericola]|uniref:DUF2530 domain-containing protein n=1 Tax=Isoptericola sediminis TaxID=2733572 RepID=A0A849K8N3_9MICO|nr:DUF2530 domain-containing protein [Isoptericola sp. 178]MDO8143927.1 DUF2530 domain-containing protein [Isoptericola sp. 178]NNU27547.1 DUF2530 domain-containing protein [Isoptericola sediminis]
MPSVMTLLLHPERRRPTPGPPAIDLSRVTLLGIACWVVALVVTGVLAAVDLVPVDVVIVCGAGIVLGLLGLPWARRHRGD